MITYLKRLVRSCARSAANGSAPRTGSVGEPSGLNISIRIDEMYTGRMTKYMTFKNISTKMVSSTLNNGRDKVFNNKFPLCYFGYQTGNCRVTAKL